MSPSQMQDVTLDTIAGGALPELFDHALKECVVNMLDPNTDPKAARGITITIEMKPGDSREQAIMKAQVKTKLAAPKPTPDVMYFGQSKRTGEIVATRYDPQQLELGEDPDDRDVVPLPHDQNRRIQ